MKVERFGSERPTAQASVVLLALTAARLFVLYPVDGVATCDQAVPVQWSITGFAPQAVGRRVRVADRPGVGIGGCADAQQEAVLPGRRRRDNGPAAGRQRGTGTEDQGRPDRDPGADLGDKHACSLHGMVVHLTCVTAGAID